MVHSVQPVATDPTNEDSFERIIGQKRVVPFLKEIRNGIWFGAHPHPLLFLGRSGQGKSALAKAFADSIKAEFVRIDCGPELKSESLVERLVGLQSLSVVLCDEFQSMRKRVQEVLLAAVDSNLVPKPEHGRLDRCAVPVPMSMSARWACAGSGGACNFRGARPSSTRSPISNSPRCFCMKCITW